jgi:hypothetical protein
MKLSRYLITLLLLATSVSADVKISALPLESASSVGINDSFPFVDASAVTTKRIKLDDLINIPAIATAFSGKQNIITPGSISTSTTGVTIGMGGSSTIGPNVTVDVQVSSGSQPGLLSSADWTTFNGAATATSAATALDTASTIVKRDASKNTALNAILDDSSVQSVNIASRSLKAADASTSINWTSRLLSDGTSTQLTWGTAGVALPALTMNTVPYMDASHILTSSLVTPTELGYVHGVTSSIQTQLNAASPMTTLGDIIYGGSSGTPTRLAGNNTTSQKFLVQTGNGSISAAPSWAIIAGSDLPNPSSSTLGGIESIAAVSHKWINTISTSGVPNLTQPDFTDLSGNLATAQLPTAQTWPTSGTVQATTPNNHGVLVSGSAAIATVIAPDASTSKVLKSGGTSADPSWLAYDDGNTASTLVARDGSGNFSAGTISAALTGTASGNTTYTANQYGVVLSGSGNAMSVLAPDASTTKLLKSGGSGANPTWLAYDNANTVSTIVARDGSGNFSAGTVTASVTGTASGNTTYSANNHGIVVSSSTNAMTVVAPDASTAKVLTSGGSSSDPLWSLVANSSLSNVSTATFKGRTTAGTGSPEDLTATQATALLNVMVGDSGSGGTKGLVPAPASGDAAAGKFLKADGSWTTPTGAGDVSSNTGTSVDNELVLFSGTTGKIIKRATGTGAVSVSSGVVTQGTLSVGNGGTGLTSITAHDLIIGNGSSAATLLAPSATSGVALISQGASSDPAYGTVVVAGGGTGLTSITAHNLIIGNGTTAATLLAPSATSGAALVSQGASSDPAYGTVVASSGGTGITSYSTNDIIYASGSTTLSKLSANSSATAKALTTTSSGAPSYSVFLDNGTYTPTLAGVNHVSSSSADLFQYIRVGNTIQVSGQITVTPSTADNVEISISLPISITGTFANRNLASGVGSIGETSSTTASGSVYAYVSHAAVLLDFAAPTTSAKVFGITFMYQFQ